MKSEDGIGKSLQNDFRKYTFFLRKFCTVLLMEIFCTKLYFSYKTLPEKGWPC